FFKDSDNAFGVFYPKDYVFAVFPGPAKADRAKIELNRSNIGDGRVISARGDEVLRFAQAHYAKNGFWGALMGELSRSIGTESTYSDQDVEAAKQGAAFVGVHCPTDEEKAKAWEILERVKPISARYYTNGGI